MHGNVDMKTIYDRSSRRKTKFRIVFLVFDKSGKRNPFYDDCLEYIGTKVSGDGKTIRVTRETDGKHLSFSISGDEVLSDIFEGIKLDYKYCKVDKSDPGRIHGQEFLEIRFDERSRDDVLYKYLPYVESKAAQMRSENRVLMVYTNSSNNRWEKTTLIHPCTFDTMAMNTNLKRFVLDDINRFIRRKEFYKKVGKA